MESDAHLIEVKSISKDYESGDTKVHAIKQMSFTVDDGEFVAIMGPSGSGKSSLLSILGGLNRPSVGRLLVDTIDIYSLSQEQRADFRSEYIGIIFQSFQLISYLSVIENVKLPMAIMGIDAKCQEDMATQVLKRVGLEDKVNRLPDQLSGGEQERVAIARAIVNNPPILLADEPTGNLDTSTAKEVMDILKQLNDNGQTILMVTHNPNLCKYSSRTIKVKDGECFLN